MGRLILHEDRKKGRTIGFGSRGRFLVKEQMRGWVVINDDGSGVAAGPFAERGEAQRAREALNGSLRPKPMLRRCLCCCEQFSSDGPHNRLCQMCANHGLPNQYVGT